MRNVIDGPSSEGTDAYRGRETTGSTPDDGPFLGRGCHAIGWVTCGVMAAGAVVAFCALLSLL